MKRTILATLVGALVCVPAALASTSPPPPLPVCTNGVTLYIDAGSVPVYLETHPGSTAGVCPTPHPTVAVASLPNPPSRVALCATTPQKRSDGTTGIFQDWLTSDWLLPTSVAHNWPLAVYGPHGLFCPDSFNLVGLTDQHVKVDGTGKTNYTGPLTLQGNIYELYK